MRKQVGERTGRVRCGREQGASKGSPLCVDAAHPLLAPLQVEGVGGAATRRFVIDDDEFQLGPPVQFGEGGKIAISRCVGDTF